jgi:hypothetical protein
LLIVLYRWFPSILQVLTIICPEPLIHWHRFGFCCYWRWKARSLGGRPPIEARLRALIRQTSRTNPPWGAPRIHGELLKLGFEVAQSSVAKYMVRRRGPPDQGWLTFPRNHAADIAAMDFCVVPTIGFRPPLCIRRHSDRARRPRLDQGHKESHGGMGCPSDHRGISLGRGSGLHEPRRRPSQCRMACPSADRGLGVGRASTRLDPRPRRRLWRCLHPAHPAMGIRDRPVSARSHWQNGYAERLIGSIRRDCLDHVVVVGERHLSTRSERTYRSRRTRRFGVMYAEQAAHVRRRSWPGYTMNIFEFEFPTRAAGRCIIIIKKPRSLAEKSWMILWLKVDCTCARANYAAGKRPSVTEHCLRGRPVMPRRSGQQSTHLNP